MRTLLLLCCAATNAFGLSTLQCPCLQSTSFRRAVATTMVDSWYDKGTRINDNDGSWIVKSWYDNGVRLTEGPPIPAGMSAAAAARSPELVKAALKCESEIAMLRFRLDSMPSAGTMFGAQLPPTLYPLYLVC